MVRATYAISEKGVAHAYRALTRVNDVIESVQATLAELGYTEQSLSARRALRRDYDNLLELKERLNRITLNAETPEVTA